MILTFSSLLRNKQPAHYGRTDTEKERNVIMLRRVDSLKLFKVHEVNVSRFVVSPDGGSATQN